MRKLYFFSLFALALGLGSFSFGQTNHPLEPTQLGLNPEKRLTQYLTRTWTVENGLPTNNVLAGTQTRDGYLWFGGFGGLVRFDGVSFQVFNSRTDSTISADGVYALQADAQNRLWVGTQGGGLLRHDKGQFYQLFEDSTLQVCNVFTMAPQGDSVMWLATSEGLLRYANDTLSLPEALAPIADKRIRELFTDHHGHLWVGTSNEGLFQYTGDTVLQITKAEGLPSDAIYSLAESADGYIWAGTLFGLAQLDHLGRVLAVHQKHPNQPTASLDAALVDNQNTLWVGGIEGLGRYYRGQWTSFEPRVGFQMKEISTLFQDKQGTLWVGTYRHGIWQVTDGKFASFSIPEGLTGGVVYALHPEQESVYVGTESGLSVVKPTGTETYLLGEGNANFIRDIYRDSQDRLWLCTYDGLVQWDQKVIRRLGQAQGLSTNQIRTLREDSDGQLWIGTRAGLYTLQGDACVIPAGLEELSNLFILSLHIDRVGKIWIGTNGNGLYCWDGKSLKQFTKADGLGTDFIFRMAEDADGALWIGTTGGLSRYWQGKFATLTSDQGLPTNVIFQALPDLQGRLWGISDANVWSANITDLSASLVDPSREVTSLQTFDKYDGLLAGQPTGVSVSAIGQDERLFIPTPLGFSVLDLTTNHRHPHPTMVIDRCLLNGREYTEDLPLSIPPGTRQMEIHYTAFDYYAPHALRFRYKLEGFDSEWQEADTRRVAIYTNLPPAEYTFLLSVASHDGEWSTEPLQMTVIQEAWFYQTLAFKVVLFIIFIGVGMIIHYSRIRLLDAHNKRLSQLVAKRTTMLEKQKKAFENQARMLESSYLQINDSILYARRIQDALLPSPKALKQWFPESFILYRPKDVVSGDFYWFEQLGDNFLVAAVDCTGHGIPGAFMSVLGNTLLTQIVNQQEILEPGAILNELHHQTILHLQHDGHSEQMKDGMDVALCVINQKEGTLTYAGAKRPLMYFDDSGLKKIKGDRYSIGSTESALERSYTQTTVPLEGIQSLYLFSDGFADQFGGPRSKKFMTRRFYHLLQSVVNLPAAAQANQLETTWLEWRGEEEQVDDILVMGITLK